VILIINISKEKLHYLEFVKPVEDILRKNSIKFITKHYKEIPKEDTSADKIIICGTSLKDNDYLDNLSYFGWIKESSKPIFGICGGMQIISLIFNGKKKKCREIGKIEVDFRKEFLGFEGRIKSYALHSLYAESKDFEIYAKSDKCPQAIKHKTKPLYGVLFHPEVMNKDGILEFCSFTSSVDKIYS